jgi:hypothetical protein
MTEKQKPVEVELEALVGERVFTGADSGILPADPDNYQYETADLFRFVLDGVTYTAQEDPSDGYRSSMQSLTLGDGGRPVPSVPPVRVLVRKMPNSEYAVNDAIEGICIENGKVLFRVGTDNTDDYYPSFVGYFDPTAMPVNAE